MKKILASLALCFGLVLATTPKSEALVGAAISAPAVVTVGGVVALGGGIALAINIGGMNGNCSGDYCALSHAFFSLMTAPIALLGIVILDGDQKGEIAFSSASIATHGQFSKAEIATYNKELSKLNAIQQTITAEVVANPKMDVNARWEKLGAKLSPATIEIAAFNGSELLKSIK